MSGGVQEAPNRGLAFAAALFEEWRRAGVEHVCLCPGSRSGPLAIAASRSGLRRWIHLDERSAAFFALGLAKATRTPVALVCTSGTAAANFAPAVIEAHYACAPLLVLTADRPPELREWGAGQTIDQHGLFGRHVRWFAEVALPAASNARLRYARALAARAAETARGAPAGPVHLNLPFRDPLDPRPVPGDVPEPLEPLAAVGRGEASYTVVHRGRVVPDAAEADALAARARSASRGAIVCGPRDAAPAEVTAIAALAERLGWPLLAEPTSQLRTGAHAERAPLVAAAHWLLSDPDFAADHAPDFALRFGAPPTSKAIARWLESAGEIAAVDPDALWHDPAHRVDAFHHSEPEALCEALLARIAGPTPEASAWRDDFLGADRAARAALARALAEREELLEPRVVPELASALPPGALLYVSSSMPVRDLDALWPAAREGPRVLCNRGANGIDGMVSSALGAAAAGAPVVLLAGDLALLHDVSGLLAAQRSGLPLAVVVIDNDGGGIFSMLPVAGFGDEAAFRELFHTPHGHDLRALCAGAGLPTVRVEGWEHFRAALKDAAAGAGPQVLIVPTDAQAAVDCRRALAAAVSAAIGAAR